jgi:phage terminase large subunit-like protein
VATLIVPGDDDAHPSLGPTVAAWMEEHLVYGPGDLRGEPLRLSADTRYLLRRLYELLPGTGRRRFSRCSISAPKGTAKSELLALISLAELAGPVRFAGWNGDGSPIGKPVTDPVVFQLATTEQQSDSITFRACMAILEESDLAGDFIIARNRIEARSGRGVLESVASTPPALEGSRVSFQTFDELEYYVTPRLLDSHKRMMGNVPKRQAAEAWSLGAGLGYEPGAGSVAEAELQAAEKVHKGEVDPGDSFYFRRWAAKPYDLRVRSELEEAIREARGVEASAWIDVGKIAAQWDAPGADPSDLERVWLNRTIASSSQAFDMIVLARRIRPGVPPRKTQCVIGMDGSRKSDATALAGCTLDGHLFEIATWERVESDHARWEVPELEVDERLREAMHQWRVEAVWCDPFLWQARIHAWSKEHGKKVVQVYDTTKALPTATATRNLVEAFAQGDATWDGSPTLFAHFANARRRPVQQKDPETGQPLYVPAKVPGSTLYMDQAMACVIAWAARRWVLEREKVRGGAQVLFAGGTVGY